MWLENAQLKYDIEKANKRVPNSEVKGKEGVENLKNRIISVNKNNVLLLKETQDKDTKISKKYKNIDYLEKYKRLAEEYSRELKDKSKRDMEKIVKEKSERF